MNHNLGAASSSRSMEDEEEFFECLEEVPPTFSSDSMQEGKIIDKHSQLNVGSSQSHLFYSGYETWKRDLETIPERRQRLLIEMGLEYRREGNDNSGSLVHSSSTEPAVELYSTSASSMTPINPFQEEAMHENLESHMTSNLTKAVNFSRNIPSEVLPRSITRSKSDGSFSELEEVIGKDDNQIHSIKSGTNSPLPSKACTPFSERLLEKSGAVLGSGFGVNMSADRASKPPLAGKRTTGVVSKKNSSSPSMSGIVAYREQSRLSNSSREAVTSICRTSQNIEAHHHGIFPQGSRKEREFRERGICTAETDADGLCRIKNLDNGKESLVDKLGQDGLWRKLKELETGRELTWEEFETSLGLSPIMQEVIRRERAEDNEVKESQTSERPGLHKKKRGMLKFMKWVVRSAKERGLQSSYGSGSDEKEGSMEKGGRRSDSTTDDSQEIIPQQRFKHVKVHSHRKSAKEFSNLHLMQEFQAHQGAIWTMKFSSDGLYLASAGQDCIVLVWEVVDGTAGGESPDVLEELRLNFGKTSAVNGTAEKQIQTEAGGSSLVCGGRKKSPISTHQPSKFFFLSEKPRCIFQGHTEEILDLSWSRSQFLLSSSMDKTVRLWHASKKECLRIFAHHDYGEFRLCARIGVLSGSLDDKVRIWSIKHHQVVDWVDLREMVTAACYRPDGQGAVVGSYKGTCRLYKLSGDKLQLEAYIDVQGNKSKKSRGKRITGVEFIPGEDWKLLVTSNDSRIRVYNHTEIINKYKGFRNSHSQIYASFSPDRKHILCASEDSRVYIWTYIDSHSSQSDKWKEKSGSYEYFCSQNVLVAIPWSGLQHLSKIANPHSSVDDLCSSGNTANKVSSLTSQISSGHLKFVAGVDLQSEIQSKNSSLPRINNCIEPLKVYGNFSHISGSGISIVPGSCAEESSGGSLHFQCVAGGNHSLLSENRKTAALPEENLPSNLHAFSKIDALELKGSNISLHVDTESDPLHVDKASINRNTISSTSAWGLVIVTASLSGEIRIFQNYS